MKKHGTTIMLFVVLFVGLILLLYPSVSDYYNSFHQSRAIATYANAVDFVEEKDYSSYWADAEEYNSWLAGQSVVQRMVTAVDHREQYDKLLNVDGSGILGILDIPEIAVTLPVYHSTSEMVLQVAVGHLEGSSLPTGTPGTHSAFSAHRGLPSAKLFTNLDQLTYGDLFTLRVLDRIFTYEIDQILIVLPHQVESLEIVDGQDYCSLITCTPYGINSHRLIIRGHRVENSTAEQAARITADALQIDPMIVAPIVSAPMLLVLLVIMLINTSPKKVKAKAKAKALTVQDVVEAVAQQDNSDEGGERP